MTGTESITRFFKSLLPLFIREGQVCLVLMLVALQAHTLVLTAHMLKLVALQAHSLMLILVALQAHTLVLIMVALQAHTCTGADAGGP